MATATTPTSPGTATPHWSRLPVSFFTVVMGLSGLSIAWTRAGLRLGAPVVIGTALFWLAVLAYAVVAAAYATKAVRHPALVRAEFTHPISVAFVSAISIGPLLLAAAGQTVVPDLARWMWWIAMPVQLVFTLYVLAQWLGRPVFELQHVTPAWFIPVVGTLAVPLAGSTVGSVDISWFFFSVGAVFWLALFPIVLHRLFVHEQPVPAPMLPTLAILIAPPAVAMLGYLRLVPDGGYSVPVRILYSVALFLSLLLLTQLPRLRKVPFGMPSWAYSFPLTAITAATIVTAAALDSAWLDVLAWVLLVGVTALIAYLVVATLRGVASGKLFLPPHHAAPAQPQPGPAQPGTTQPAA